MSRRRLIVGAGALGALLAAQWRAAGVPAVLIARGAALEVIRERGVTVRRPHGDEAVPVDVVGAIDETEPAVGDSVVLAVKAQDAEQALAAIAWRPLLFIIGANLLFGVLLGGLPALGLPPMGLIVAVYALTLVSSLAGDQFNLKSVLILATVLAVGSYVAFVWALNLQFPVWPTFIVG